MQPLVCMDLTCMLVMLPGFSKAVVVARLTRHILAACIYSNVFTEMQGIHADDHPQIISRIHLLS